MHAAMHYPLQLLCNDSDPTYIIYLLLQSVNLSIILHSLVITGQQESTGTMQGWLL